MTNTFHNKAPHSLQGSFPTFTAKVCYTDLAQTAVNANEPLPSMFYLYMSNRMSCKSKSPLKGKEISHFVENGGVMKRKRMAGG